MAQNALRTICLAYKDLNDSEDLSTKDKLGVYDIETKGFTLIFVFGIADVVRPEVPDAIKNCLISYFLKFTFFFFNIKIKFFIYLLFRYLGRNKSTNGNRR